MPENVPTQSETHNPMYRTPAPLDVECRNDLQCRIDALQKIVTQLLVENQRLRLLAPQN
jgi:hypothetical protein